MPERWVILADVHLGTPATQFPKQDYTYTPDLLRQAVERAAALKPDRVVIVGDLVNMGVAQEYAVVAKLLAPVRHRAELMIGNHELVKGSIADFERFAGVSAARELTSAPLPTFLLNSGIEGLPLTEWRGRVDDDQLTRLRSMLQRANGPAVVFCHHPLTATVRRSTEPMMSLDNSGALRAILESHPHDVLLFTGHTHYQNIVPLGRLTCIACPPLAFWPHAMLVVEIDHHRISLHTEYLFDSPSQSPDRRAADPDYRALGEGAAADQTLRAAIR
jgi:3',5'-cyclic AMP phosphodiesterase CpdA